MWMHGQREILCCRTHFDGEHAFSDQFARAESDDADPENAFCVWFDDQFCQALRTIKGKSATRCGPGKFRNLNLDAFLFCFGLSQPAPGEFRISKDYCGNCNAGEGAI